MKRANFDLYVLHTESLYSRGGEKYLYELLLRVTKTHRVFLYLHAISPKWRRLYEKANISVTVLWKPPRFFWLLLPVTLIVNFLQLKRTITRDQVVFATNFPMNFLAVLVSTRTICHCFEPLAIFYDPLRVASLAPFSRFCVRVAKFAYSWLDTWAFHKATVLTALAPSVEPYIIETYHRTPDVFLPNGVDTDLFTPSRKSVHHSRPTWTIGHSTDYTIFKGTENFLPIIDLLHRVGERFVVHISESITDRTVKQQYISYVRSHNLSRVVRFVGTINENDLPDYYRSLDLFVYTGSTKSAGGSTASLSVLEAQASGVPVIRSHGDDNEIIDGKTGFAIDPANHKEGAETIKRFFRLSPKEKQDMKKQSRTHILTRFSWERASAILIQTAQTMISL